MTGGGYEAVGDSFAPAFTDAAVRDGVPYHYVVVAFDERGNVSARSDEAVAVPQLTITDLVLRGVVDDAGAVVNAVERALSAVDGAVEVEVAVDATAEGPRSRRASLWRWASDPRRSAPSAVPAWTWSPAEAVEVTGSGAVFRGQVQPEELGGFTAAARASTDGGETWQTAIGVGHIDTVRGDDTVSPPAARDAPELLDVSGERVRFRWAAPEADDIHRYLILRAPGNTMDFEVIGTSDVEVFLDATVSAGAPTLRIRAQDTAYNTSERSEVLDVTAEERVVEVTFTVTVPEYTTARGHALHRRRLPGLEPRRQPHDALDDTTWTITLPFEDATELEYKYARGSWEAVEKDAGCGEIANRTLTVEYSAGGTQEVADTIEKWRDLDECP